MAVLSEGSLVLVTGATGYVGYYVVRELLSRGFHVRATARSSSKGEAFVNHPTFKDDIADNRLTYVVVPDIQIDGAFDDTLKDVDGIVHVASPLLTSIKSSIKDDLVNPAIAGTLGILKSVLGYPRIKRVVITSSFVAMMDIGKEPGTVVDEKDWNHGAVKLVEELGDKVDPMIGYMASKTLAEQAAWKFMDEKKPHFDLVTILPTMVYGPFGIVTSPKELDYCNGVFFKYLIGSPEVTPESAHQGAPNPLVDVRDVAYAHAESLIRPSAANRRFALLEGLQFWQAALDVLHDKHSDLASSFPNAHWGVHGAKGDGLQYGTDPTPSRELLGLEYRSFEESVKALVESALEAKEKYDWVL